MLIVSSNAKISPLAEIEYSLRGSKIIIGGGVVINSFVKFKPVGGMGDVIICPRSDVTRVVSSGNLPLC